MNITVFLSREFKNREFNMDMEQTDASTSEQTPSKLIVKQKIKKINSMIV